MIYFFISRGFAILLGPAVKVFFSEVTNFILFCHLSFFLLPHGIDKIFRLRRKNKTRNSNDQKKNLYFR